MDWTVHAGATGVIGSLALLVALLMWTFGGQMWKPCVLGLTVTGVAGILSTPIGDWVRIPVAWLADHTGWIGTYTGVGLMVLLAVALAVMLVLSVLGHFTGRVGALLSRVGLNDGDGISGRTLVLGGASTITAGLIPGPVGAAFITVLGAVVQLFAWLITLGLGL